MSSPEGRSAPFTRRVLESGSQAASPSRSFKEMLADLLPASERTPSGNLSAPAERVSEWLDRELNLHRLTDLFDSLWFAGRPMPPHPLHLQRFFGREIVVTEHMDLHLVWGGGRTFMKPLPRYLLEPQFWEEYLPHSHPHKTPINGYPTACSDTRRRALGFLHSYVALVAHESDFHIAKASNLLPQELQWQPWKMLVQELLNRGNVYQCVDKRFYYGELRLSRFNKIYLFRKTPLRGYMPRWNQYGAFLSDHLPILASSTVYIAIVLTAMQVGFATDLQDNATFQKASYHFTVFSIIGPLAAASLLIITFVYFFAWNWAITKRDGRKRLEDISSSCEIYPPPIQPSNQNQQILLSRSSN
ncbi:hypothetical protein BDP55DRAFT_700766 [Colletotrichum godetiae]|uniref:Subtilisin-like serine protease n=1 Tax=Colletotrichum godetiae TaxID=1209918 RepID=A0AAJ0AVV3_9PEZI|nr:uncharacterized protein BDP55DRAFT_700766 [Colletotrichum godetiae]KAK1691275.1 hypothetical protein BDP55DRAFT_700766 [Colletotrichum godetiae]